VASARRVHFFSSQSRHIEAQFTGQKGSYVPVKETVKGFKDLLAGKYDHIPEDAFRSVGRIEDVLEKAKDMGVEV
ncbi:F0F1 ATP synthase subunit beta, partial [Escherichia coli]|nr:F0F1 ATP synthase subunit beta [Escherichia coli]